MRPVPSFLLSCVLGLGLSTRVWAQHVAHRPWFSRRPSSTVVNTLPTLPPSSRHPRESGDPEAPIPMDSRFRGNDIKTVRDNQPSTLSPNQKGDKIAHQALRYQGTRYRFGGKSKQNGFDCSGFVMRVYNDLKLKKLPHTSAALYQMGTPIRQRDLRAGDLVFFRNTYRRGISHVGVYVGRDRFVHARNRRFGVTLTALSDPYYQLHYAGARRLY